MFTRRIRRITLACALLALASFSVAATTPVLADCPGTNGHGCKQAAEPAPGYTPWSGFDFVFDFLAALF